MAREFPYRSSGKKKALRSLVQSVLHVSYIAHTPLVRFLLSIFFCYGGLLNYSKPHLCEDEDACVSWPISSRRLTSSPSLNSIPPWLFLLSVLFFASHPFRFDSNRKVPSIARCLVPIHSTFVDTPSKSPVHMFQCSLSSMRYHPKISVLFLSTAIFQQS